jgi:hypothetical protein
VLYYRVMTLFLQVSGRIILDFDASQQHSPGSTTSPKPTKAVLSEYPPQSLPESQGEIDVFTSVRHGVHYEILEEHALLCPRTVRGFSLQDKIWADFRVDKIQDIKYDNSCFDKLQIDKDVKTVLQSLILQHTKSGRSFKDIIAGKGRGLAILLHGPPGSGKTLTAGKCVFYNVVHTCMVIV